MPMLFHCRATCIVCLVRDRLILLLTYTARGLMVSDLHMSAPIVIKVLRPVGSLKDRTARHSSSPWLHRSGPRGPYS